ncbi:hypothetical protein, partial [Bacteroides nordii]|uniref:hypothetical protein n=1 Tax=Bacteroides nordii TaxID=291645 RepID=UPI001C70120C
PPDVDVVSEICQRHFTGLGIQIRKDVWIPARQKRFVTFRWEAMFLSESVNSYFHRSLFV